MEPNQKPTFDVFRPVTTIKIGNTVYNAEPIGPGNFHKLRAQNYGEGFRQATFGETFHLFYAARINPESPEAKRILQVNRKNVISANTALYGGDKGSEWVFAQDFPEVKEGRIVMSQDDLVARLEYEGKKVLTDSLHINPQTGVMAMKREGFRNEIYSVYQMLASDQPILFTGNEQAPIQMAAIMELTNQQGYLSIPSPGDIRVPVLDENSSVVYLNGHTWNEFCGDSVSFGVSQ